MNTIIVNLLILLWLLSLSFEPINAQSENYKKGELIVWLYPNFNARSFSDLSTLRQMKLSPIKNLSKRLNIWLFAFDSLNLTAQNALSIVRNQVAVRSSQLNRYVKIRFTPNDDLFNDQWALNNIGQTGGTQDADIDAVEAWDISTSGESKLGESIVVAVIDGGFDLNHEDLNYWKNSQETPNNGLDDDDNGYIDDYDGWNAYNSTGIIPNDYHGTHVAGIATARGNNSIGVTGVAWNAKILPIAGSSGDEATVVEAYSYAYEMRALYNETNGEKGAFIVSTNSSFGVDFGDPEDYPIWCEMYDIMGSVGILSSAATANLNIDIDIEGDMPTACESYFLISVTNTTDTDEKNWGAAYGETTIDLGAPGTDILSTYPGNNYSELTGTSMASPHVAGSVALMFGAVSPSVLQYYRQNPEDVATQIKDFIIDGADPIPDLQSTTVSGGRLNIFNSMNSAADYTIPDLVLQNDNIEQGESMLYEATNSILVAGQDNQSNPTTFVIMNGGNLTLYVANAASTGIILKDGFSAINGCIFHAYIGTQLAKLAEGSVAPSPENVDKSEPANLKKSFEFKLKSNFPNPFNPRTIIGYELARDGIVKITIYDILGREIKTLVNEFKFAGDYTVGFNAADLPSGIYFYSISAGNFNQVKKMVLLK